MIEIRNLNELYKAIAGITEDISGIERTLREACHRIECIERACDAHGHMLYTTDKSVLEIKKQISMLSSGLSIPTNAVLRTELLVQKLMEGKE